MYYTLYHIRTQIVHVSILCYDLVAIAVAVYHLSLHTVYSSTLRVEEFSEQPFLCCDAVR
jgi:hypothetical protein